MFSLGVVFCAGLEIGCRDYLGNKSHIMRRVRH